MTAAHSFLVCWMKTWTPGLVCMADTVRVLLIFPPHTQSPSMLTTSHYKHLRSVPRGLYLATGVWLGPIWTGKIQVQEAVSQSNSQPMTNGSWWFKTPVSRTSMAVQWLRPHVPNAESSSSIPGQGTRSYMIQLKIPHATTKIQCNQINTFYKTEWRKWWCLISGAIQ